MSNKLIKEALGVRPELLELANTIYASVINNLYNNKDIRIGKNPEYSFIVGNLNFPIRKGRNNPSSSYDVILTNINEVEVILSFKYNNEETPNMTTAAFNLYSVDSNNSYMREKKSIDKISNDTKPVFIFYITGNKNTKLSEVADLLIIKQSKLTTLLVHELKHMYDKYVYNKKDLTSDVNYSVNFNTYLDNSVNKYAKKIAEANYFTAIVELHVRATEAYSFLMSKYTTKKNFLNQLNQLSTIPRYKGYIETFDYYNFYSEIFKNLFDSDYNTSSLFHIAEKVLNIKNPSREKIAIVGVEYTLYLIRIQYFKDVTSFSKDMFPFYNFISFWKKIGFFKKDVNINPKDIVNKLSLNNYYYEPKFSKESFKKNEFFFKKMFKNIRYRSNNILRKIYKIYSLLPDNPPRLRKPSSIKRYKQ